MASQSPPDRPAIAPESPGHRPSIAPGTLPDANRTRRANNPLSGLDLRSAKGRQVRDLFRERMAIFDDDTAADMTVQLAVRRVVELQVISEGLRAEMLAAEQYDQRLGVELVRIENLVRRAEVELDKLIAEATQPESWYERQQRETGA